MKSEKTHLQTERTSTADTRINPFWPAQRLPVGDAAPGRVLHLPLGVGVTPGVTF